MNGGDLVQRAPHTDDRASWPAVLGRLVGLRSIGAVPRSTPGPTVFAMCALLLAAWAAIDYAQRRPDPEFAAAGIPLFAWYAAAIAMLAATLRRMTRPRPEFGALLVLSVGAAPLPFLVTSLAAVYLDPPWFWASSALVCGYLLVYFARGLGALCGVAARNCLPAAVAGVVLVGVFAVLCDVLDAVPDIWNPRSAEARVSDDAVADAETALFLQANRIDAAVDAIRRAPGNAAQGFFLGFAGVGDQKVFAQEVGLASRVLGERYKIDARELSLINDERDLERAPLASVTGLRYALSALATRMDLSRDVLFLAISSHGSEGASIAVSNSQMPLTDLTDDDLADALHEAGIKWRVVVISACYAGGFIGALRDPRTIVITAAAADRTSFGCSNDSDLTYFGEAFYRDALPEAHSLRQAFETAKTAIAAREHAEGETPSNPQAFFGAEIEAKLGKMSGDAVH